MVRSGFSWWMVSQKIFHIAINAGMIVNLKIYFLWKVNDQNFFSLLVNENNYKKNEK